MPLIPTYPGVYIEEISGGVRPIEGVPTSTAAFIGRASRGPTDAPRLVTSFTEFERLYGGLWLDAPMTFAVQQYFMNGGRDALICRVHHGATAATLVIPVGAESLTLVAASDGQWGNGLRVRFEAADPAADGSEAAEFSLSVKDLGTATIEVFDGLSTDPSHPRFATRVLREQSNLVGIGGDGGVPARRPPANAAAPAGHAPLDADPSSMPFRQDGTDGEPLVDADFAGAGLEANQQGMWLLEHVDLFNVLCIPPLGRDLDVARST